MQRIISFMTGARGLRVARGGRRRRRRVHAPPPPPDQPRRPGPQPAPGRRRSLPLALGPCVHERRPSAAHQREHRHLRRARQAAHAAGAAGARSDERRGQRGDGAGVSRSWCRTPSTSTCATRTTWWPAIATTRSRHRSSRSCAASDLAGWRVMQMRVAPDAAAAADEAAAWTARQLRNAVRRRGAASLAVSGGTHAGGDVRRRWPRSTCRGTAVTVCQVDERVAPDGDPARNAVAARPVAGAPRRTVRLMPVTARDLRAAARRYAAALPERFDVVHLGLGDDGHTASWPPGDPVIDADGAGGAERGVPRVRADDADAGRGERRSPPSGAGAGARQGGAGARLVAGRRVVAGAARASRPTPSWCSTQRSGRATAAAVLASVGRRWTSPPPPSGQPCWPPRGRRTCARCSPTIPAAPSATSPTPATCASTSRSTSSTTRGGRTAGRRRGGRRGRAPRRDVRRRADQHHRAAGGAAHRAPRARHGDAVMVDGHDVVPDVHEVLDRMAVFAERVRNGEWTGATGQRHPHRRQHRHRRQRPRPGDGVPGHRGVRPARAARAGSSATSTAPTSPATSPTSTRPPRWSSSARRRSPPSRPSPTPPRPAAGWPRRSATTPWRSTSSPSAPTPRRWPSSASTPPTCSASGTGSAAATRSTRPSACR